MPSPQIPTLPDSLDPLESELVAPPDAEPTESVVSPSDPLVASVVALVDSPSVPPPS